jgi:putative sigma-54 modulation protein
MIATWPRNVEHSGRSAVFPVGTPNSEFFPPAKLSRCQDQSFPFAGRFNSFCWAYWFGKEFASVQIAITCRHGNVRDEVREYISEKSQKLLTYFERVTAIEVTVDFNKDHVKVEMQVDTEHKHDFVAHDMGEEVQGTFDSVMHKMEQQIRKYKSKIQDHRRDVPLGEITGQTAETETEEL